MESMSREELEALFLANERKFFLIALAVTGSSHRAMDAVQDALVSCLHSEARPDAPLAYLCTCVRRAARKVQMRETRESPLDAESRWLAVDESSENAVFADQANRAMRDLSPAQREVVILHLHHGLRFREIAELQDRSINTITSQYRRALQQLRSLLDHEQ